MEDKNSSISTALLALATFLSLLLFVGLFSARWEQLVESFWGSAFVLVLGTLVPLLCVLSIIFAIRGFYQYESSPCAMKLVALLCIFFLALFYFMSSINAVIDLYKIKLGIL